ncbi:MAG: SpoIIE family protein phosphatase [Bacilli bacterium]|nr:SpoIIE family protein phosphatase [Bacilli bacterium]
MNKYLNIIIISFFTVLSSNYNIGFTLYIPVVCFLAFSNSKNMLLIVPSSLLAMFWFNSSKLIELGVLLSLIILFIMLVKTEKIILNLTFIFVLAIGFMIYNYPTMANMIYNLLFSLVATVLYGYFCYNQEGALVKESRSRNFAYNEVIMAITSVIGATTISFTNIHISVFVAIFFSMYLSKNNYPFHSVFYSLINMFFLRFLFKIEESLLIPFVSAFYLFPSIYAPAALISFSLLGWATNIDLFNVTYLQVTIGIAIFFEIVKGTIISVHSSDDIIRGAYSQAMENANNEIIAFASFLDLFSKDFSESKEYTQKLSEGINNLTHNYCEGCYVRSECYKRNKGKLYTFFKNLIMYSKRSDYELRDAEAISFFKSCPYIVEMRKSSILINERLNITNANTKINTLVAQMNGFSTVLRQFSVDNALKTEFDYDVFEKIYKGLNDYGYNVCYFDPKKINTTDFVIEVGIKGENFKNIKDIIEDICNIYIENKVTCLFKSALKGKTYITIIPKINYEIEYGYGSIAQEGNNICGDNYLIKNLNNSKLIAAISDGMGKGYVANQESSTTLKLVDEITKTSLTTETALQILNTFYFIQDYLEKYSTLDFLEIDRSKGELLFYKMGAASSYIFHKNGTFQKVENEGLPFGIEEIIEAKKYRLQKEDLIVMASDGIFENIVDEKELETYIKGIMHLSPQKITYEILNYARSHKNKTQDDMSVIALKVLAN